MKLKLAKLLMKILGHRRFNILNGGMKVMNVPVIFYTGDVLIDLRDKIGYKETTSAIYWLAKLQAFNATTRLIKIFGLKNGGRYQEFMDLFLDQIVMVGLGRPDFEVVDDSLPHFRFSCMDSTFAKEYLDMHGKSELPVCDYLGGLAAGGMQALFETEEELIAVETKCIAQGSDKCYFEVKPKSMFTPEELKSVNYSPQPEYFDKFRLIETAITSTSRK